MAEHTATVGWSRRDEPFVDNRYNRAHEWRFDGGACVAASSSPHAVKVPLSDPAGVDPEEAFVASLASCHMLWFLSIAATRGFVIDSYVDQAVGHLGRNDQGRMAMLRVVLRPRIAFSGDKLPTDQEMTEMHERAHHECYIANSVRTVVTVEAPAE